MLLYHRIVEKMYEKLEPLTKADPHLLYGFMYICPWVDLNNLIRKIPPFFSIAYIAHELEIISRSLNEDSVRLTIVTTLNEVGSTLFCLGN